MWSIVRKRFIVSFRLVNPGWEQRSRWHPYSQRRGLCVHFHNVGLLRVSPRHGSYPWSSPSSEALSLQSSRLFAATYAMTDCWYLVFNITPKYFYLNIVIFSCRHVPLTRGRSRVYKSLSFVPVFQVFILQPSQHVSFSTLSLPIFLGLPRFLFAVTDNSTGFSSSGLSLFPECSHNSEAGPLIISHLFPQLALAVTPWTSGGGGQGKIKNVKQLHGKYKMNKITFFNSSFS